MDRVVLQPVNDQIHNRRKTRDESCLDSDPNEAGDECVCGGDTGSVGVEVPAESDGDGCVAEGGNGEPGCDGRFVFDESKGRRNSGENYRDA
jgi:hypothetical protein